MTPRRIILSIFSVLTISAVALPAMAAEIFLHSSFSLHAFDDAILKALAYHNGSVVYLSELSSQNEELRKVRENYEEFGCHPFQLLQNGTVEEIGYNCETFFCVGYLTGPKVCRDRNNASYAGVEEIKRRYDMPRIRTTDKPFADFSVEDQTDSMKRQIDERTPLRCRPFYRMLFDIAVGEGYLCDEVGEYPYFSSANTCITDWRNNDGQVCTVPLREDEFAYRRKAIKYREAGDSETDVDETATGSISSSAASSSASSRHFSDVLVGHYGYTAITDLARRSIVTGYDDGTFRPYATVNRAEFAKLLIGGLHAAQLQQETGCFPDVANEWFSGFVCAAKRLGWIKGYDDGSFHADRTIKKSEAMKIIIASLGVPLDSIAVLPPGTPDNEWYSPYIRKAMELQLILEASFNPGADVTRGDAAVWIYRSLKTAGK